jgi:hypothetical protein
MRTFASLFALVLFFSLSPAIAQPHTHAFDLKVEPLSYAFGGAGGHVGVQGSDWRYTLEVFTLDVPESLHGNDGFSASPLGAELHVERSFGDTHNGFYVGPEVGVVRLKVTHRASGTTEQRTRYSVGIRGGYRWYTGLGNLYLSPVVGLSYTLNDADVDVGPATFESASLGPWGTVGIGWTFFR